LFEAIAIRNGRNPKFEVHVALGAKNTPIDFNTMGGSGWALHNVCTYPKDGELLRHHIWVVNDGITWFSFGVQLGSLPELLKRWKRDGLKPTGCVLDGPDVGKGVPARPLSIQLERDQGQTWEFFPELSARELVAKLAEARKQGRRPDLVSSVGNDKNRTYSLSLVPNTDKLAWHFECNLSETRFETLLAGQKKLGRRPLIVMSEVQGVAPKYMAVWIQYSPSP
jgi:hypothetical protein